jgi:hypothetical protein
MRRSSQIRYISLGSRPANGQSSGGLLGRIAALLIGAVFFGVTVFLGAIFLAGIVGLVLIGGTIFMCRVWWLRRKMERYASKNADLDAEYTVIRESDPRD